MGTKLAGVLSTHATRSGGDRTTTVDQVPLAHDAAGLAGDRAREVDLELERRVGRAGRQGAVDGAAHRRVEQRRGEPAVDHADRVVVVLLRRDREHRAALRDLDELEPEQDRHRRRRDLARSDPVHVLQARQALGPGRGGDWVIPGDRALAWLHIETNLAPWDTEPMARRPRRKGGTLKDGE